jgi:hypothetical protein
VPVNESHLVAYVIWLAMELEAGRRSVADASLPKYISAVRVVAKSFFDGQETLTAGRMPIFQALLRAYGQLEARSFPRLTNRGDVQADIIQATWANAMQSEERVVIRDAAAAILAYMLGLRELSVMSLPAENITHTAAKMTVRLVLVKGKALRHAVLATYARTGVALRYHRLSACCRSGLVCGLRTLCSSVCPEKEMTGSWELFLALCSAACMQWRVVHRQARHGHLILCELELTRNRRYWGSLWRCGRLYLAGAQTAMI